MLLSVIKALERWFQGQAIASMALMAMVVVLFSPLCLAQDRCRCTLDGLSNGVQTNTPGCVLRTPSSTRPSCFVSDSANCPEATSSPQYLGAALTTCSVEEAVFFATESDDIATILLFRELGASFQMSRNVSFGRFGYRVVPLAVYAAARGSFDTMEDLLVNEDFRCDDQDDLLDELCRLSEDPQCRQEDSRRQAMEALIDFVTSAVCGPVSTDVVQDEVEAEAEGSIVAFLEADIPCEVYPYFVSVRSSFEDGYRHVCGGALISEETVLTAAHCLDVFIATTDAILFIGAQPTADISSGCHNAPEVRRAVEAAVHPMWPANPTAERLGNGYDIAVLRLNKPSSKKPINIQRRGRAISNNDTLRFIGADEPLENNELVSTVQVRDEYVVNKSTCQIEYDSTFPKAILCTAGGESENCQEDGGSPLIDVNADGSDRLVGIAHQKHPLDTCGESNFSVLYTGISELAKWIRRKQRQFQSL